MRVSIALVVALAVGCGGSTSSTPKTTAPPPELPPSAMDARTQIQKLADRACACKKAASKERVGCARTVVHDLVTLAHTNTETVGQENAATDLDDAGQRLGKCVIDAGLPAQELADEMKKIPAPKES